MKVLHIVAGELNGGAARGAYWLHKGLRKIGVDSSVLCNSLDTLGEPEVTTIADSKVKKAMVMIFGQLDGLLAYMYPNRKKVIFSTGFIGNDIRKTKAFKEADIIHLHWINFGFVNFKHLKNVKKPIVWTMRDMWPMTGGCHVAKALDCEAYETGCGNCPQLGSNFSYDLSKIVINRKRKLIPKDMKLIGMSNWLSECAKKSVLFREFDIRTIPNNIDCREFFPIPKELARKILGLPLNKKIVLAATQSSDDFYKGFDKYIMSLNYIEKEDVHLLFFGRIMTNLVENLGFEYTSLGFLNDTISMRLAYSAADVFVSPSMIESFGKTIAEAMACGTPAVCFNVTGQKDIVDHKVNGYLAHPFNPDDLANGIKWVLEQDSKTLNLSNKARKKIENKFDIITVAKKYQTLYQEIMDSKE